MIGIAAALAVLGVVVLTILGRGTYRSMLFEEQRSGVEQPSSAQSASVQSSSMPSADAPGVEAPDSLGAPAADSVRSDAGSADRNSKAAESEIEKPAAGTTGAAGRSVGSAS